MSDGVVRDPSSAIHLIYAQLPSPVASDDEDDEEEAPYDVFTSDTRPPDRDRDKPMALPLSPISNKSRSRSRSMSPGRLNGTKRPRLDEWPDHVPEFLPPFPSTSAPPPIQTQTSPTKAVKLRHKSVAPTSGAISYSRSALANLPSSMLPPTIAPAPLPPINSNPTLGSVIDPAVALREALANHSLDPTPPIPSITTPSAATTSLVKSKAARILAGALSQAFDAADSLFGPWGGSEARASGVGGEGVPVLVDQQGEMMVNKKGADKASALVSSGVGGRVISREEDVGGVMGTYIIHLNEYRIDIVVYRLLQVSSTAFSDYIYHPWCSTPNNTYSSTTPTSNSRRRGQHTTVLSPRTRHPGSVVCARARGRRRSGQRREHTTRRETGSDVGLGEQELRSRRAEHSAWAGCGRGCGSGQSGSCGERGGGVISVLDSCAV